MGVAIGLGSVLGQHVVLSRKPFPNSGATRWLHNSYVVFFVLYPVPVCPFAFIRLANKALFRRRIRRA